MYFGKEEFLAVLGEILQHVQERVREVDVLSCLRLLRRQLLLFRFLVLLQIKFRIEITPPSSNTKSG